MQSLVSHIGRQPAATASTRGTAEDLFRREYRRLAGALSLATGDAEAAADAVQEAFVQAWLNWNKVGAYDNPAAWVRRVAINHLLNGERSLRRRAAALLRLQAPPADSPTDNVGGPLVNTELARCVRMLPEKPRVALLLRYVADMTAREIAEAMDLSEGAVNQHLRRARARLRDLMDGSDG